MTAEILFYIWASLLLIVNVVAWCSTFLSLPGNWIILAATAVFAAFVRVDDVAPIGWKMVLVVAVLAIAGEIIEMVAGAAGAAKQGASRRAMLLAIVGTVIGSLVGAILGTFIPIPLVGTVIGAIGGGALGAFGGAYLGEWWKGRAADERLAISVAAMIGRLLGTMGKLVVGAIMVVVVTIDSFF